jgi:DNA-binding transcriptional ArsR family regulator
MPPTVPSKPSPTLRAAKFCVLRQGEMTAGDLACHFDMSKPTMSHHFAVLADADLITRRREGQTIWYGLNTTVLAGCAGLDAGSGGQSASERKP